MFAKILLTAVPVVAAVGFGIAVRAGLLAKVNPKELHIDAMTVLALRQTGPYKECGSAFGRVATKAADHNVPFKKMIGFYYDDPAKTEAARCRSVVGCIVKRSDLPTIEGWLGNDFFVEEFPDSSVLGANFPYYGLPSVLLGVARVYPALDKILPEYVEGGKAKMGSMEVYDKPNHTMMISFPLTPRQTLLPYTI